MPYKCKKEHPDHVVQEFRDAEVHVTVTVEKDKKKRTLFDTVRTGDFVVAQPSNHPLPGVLGVNYSDFKHMCIGEKKKITKTLILKYVDKVDGEKIKKKATVNVDVILDVIGTANNKSQLEVVDKDGHLVAITQPDIKCMACRGLMDLWAHEWAAPAPGKEEASIKESDLGRWMAAQPKWQNFCSSDRVTHRSIAPVMRKICQRILRSSKAAILESFRHVNPTKPINDALYMNAKDVVCGQMHRRYCGADFARITTDRCGACIGVVDDIRKEIFVTQGLPYDGYTKEQIKPALLGACDHLHENHYAVAEMQDACSDITDVDTDLLVDSFEKYFMSFQKLADDVCWRHTPMCHGPIEHKDEIIMAHVSGETWGDNFVWESFENQEGGITDGSHLDL